VKSSVEVPVSDGYQFPESDWIEEQSTKLVDDGAVYLRVLILDASIDMR
jgi:hypothetical protein